MLLPVDIVVSHGLCFLQRAQYQDKLARQRYDDQLRQQVTFYLLGQEHCIETGRYYV